MPTSIRHRPAGRAARVLLAAAVMASAAAAPVSAADPATRPDTHSAAPPAAAPATALLRTHCGSCHFDGAAEGGIEIDALLVRHAQAAAPAAGGRDHSAWLAVWRALGTETMPPADEPRPTSGERRQLIRFVERSVFGLDPARPDPGPTVVRRLNRVEYANTVRDLIGLETGVIDDLPPDDTGHGFDTVGAALTMSPLLVEKYLAAATRIADAVVEATRVPGPAAGAEAYPEAVRRLFPEGPPPAAAAARDRHLRATIARLAERAYRGPVDPDSVERLTAVARSAMDADGAAFARGVAAALTAVLASPRFLLRIEAADAGAAAAEAPTEAFDPDGGPSPTAVPIDEFALASRLSYLLWSSMPDDELCGLARAGRLHAELPRQVDRMIADSRSDEFVRNFVGQWLQTRDVETAAFDFVAVLGTRDPSAGERIFNARVRAAMRQETELLFAHLLRGNLPCTDLLVGRQTFLNAALAKFYGIRGIEGAEMRLVSLPPDSRRGGLLSHGSFLVVTSNPTRTAPVKRGRFVLDNLLGTPPPPPPPNVPPLEASAHDSDRQPSMRKLMERHRSDPLCASCHARMDPLGLALEEYDAIGRWRGDGPEPLDTSGRLITGESFAGAEGLARVIAGPRRRDFHRCVAEKMLTYALGRGLEYFDAPAVDTIMERVDRDGGLATLVTAICDSVPFRMRRPDGRPPESARGPTQESVP